VKFSIVNPNQHCIAWAKVTASLWGMANDHDLDEPVQLTDVINIRVRLTDGPGIVADRNITFITQRPGTHVMLRLYFKNGRFEELPLEGASYLGTKSRADVTLNGGPLS